MADQPEALAPRKRPYLMIVAIVSVALNLVVAGMFLSRSMHPGKQGMTHHGKHSQHNQHKMMDKQSTMWRNMDPELKKGLKQLMQEHRVQAGKMRATVKEARQRIVALTEQETLDAAALKQALADLQSLQAAKAASHADSLIPVLVASDVKDRQWILNRLMPGASKHRQPRGDHKEGRRPCCHEDG